MTKTINLCEVRSFSTSPNLCQRATVLNADVTMLHNAVIISLHARPVTLTCLIIIIHALQQRASNSLAPALLVSDRKSPLRLILTDSVNR